MARSFLYGHEAFHHLAEAFGTRLEVTHRVPIFKMGMESFYRKTFDTDECIEEALADAHAYRRVEQQLKAVPCKREILEKLKTHLADGHPGYRKAVEHLNRVNFESGRNKFAELSHQTSLPGIKGRADLLWMLSPHAFTGFEKVTGKANYIIRKDSPLASRIRHTGRFLRHRDLAYKLREFGCKETGRQKGSHEIWLNPMGSTFPVPRHNKDLKTGTLGAIIKQAGIKMTLHDFLRTC